MFQLKECIHIERQSMGVPVINYRIPFFTSASKD